MLKLTDTDGDPVLIAADRIIVGVVYQSPEGEKAGMVPQRFPPDRMPKAVLFTGMSQHFVMESIEDIHMMINMGFQPESN